MRRRCRRCCPAVFIGKIENSVLFYGVYIIGKNTQAAAESPRAGPVGAVVGASLLSAVCGVCCVFASIVQDGSRGGGVAFVVVDGSSRGGGVCCVFASIVQDGSRGGGVAFVLGGFLGVLGGFYGCGVGVCRLRGFRGFLGGFLGVLGGFYGCGVGVCRLRGFRGRDGLKIANAGGGVAVVGGVERTPGDDHY